MTRTLAIALLAGQIYAAIPAGAIWNIRSDATSGNVTGGFFNPGNANFFTDGTVDTNTGNTNSPVFSSASYNFVAGDVGAWLYVKSGTSTYPGWYQIASVASNKATLTATVGAGVWHNSTNRTYTASTSAGIASVGTPTSITWGIDYSQGTTSIINGTDLASSIGTTNPCTVTSAGTPFTSAYVGNGLRISAGTNWTQDWYEIVSVSGSTATLDKACGSAASISSGTFRVGGSLSLGSSDDAVFEKGIAGNDFLVKSGTYNLGGTVTIAAAGGGANPIRILGYNSLRGDNPTTTSRPVFNAGAVAFTVTTNWDIGYMSFTGTGSPLFQAGSNGKVYFSRFENTSTATDRIALTLSTDSFIYGCEAISYKGRAISGGGSSNVTVVNSHMHDSDIGLIMTTSSGSFHAVNNLIVSNRTAAIRLSSAAVGIVTIMNNTLYGAANKQGVGIDITTTGSTDIRAVGNIISGFTTGISHVDAQSVGFGAYNFYYNNTTDNTNWQIGPGSSTGTDPQFTSVTQLVNTGTVTSSTNVLTDTGADFSSVVDNRDFVTILSGSGTGFATGKYLITGHTGTTLTLSSNLTSSGSGSSITYEVTLGHNFAIGTNLKALGFPGAFPGGLTTGYMDPGAVQRQESGGGGGGAGMRIY